MSRRNNDTTTVAAKFRQLPANFQNSPLTCNYT